VRESGDGKALHVVGHEVVAAVDEGMRAGRAQERQRSARAHPQREQRGDAGGLDEGHEFHVVFGVRYVHDLIYRSLIEKWEREHSNFHFYPTISRPETPDWKGRVGYVQKVIENEITDYGNKQVFICGLHDMVEDVKNLCQRLGFAYVRFEKWD